MVEAERMLIHQALRFAVWAAGQGIAPVDGEPARDPEEFLTEYSAETDDEDWETLPERIIDALSPAPEAQLIARTAAVNELARLVERARELVPNLYDSWHQAAEEALAASHPRDTNTVEDHETEKVGDNRTCATEGCDSPATNEFIRGDVGSFYCGDCFGKVIEVCEVRPAPEAQQERPSEPAVTDAMELARAVLARVMTAGYPNAPGPDPEDVEKAFWALDDALKSAMEA